MFSRIDRALVALVGAAALAALVGLACGQVDEIETGGGPRLNGPRPDAGAELPACRSGRADLNAILAAQGHCALGWSGDEVAECEGAGRRWIVSGGFAAGGYCELLEPLAPPPEVRP